MANDKPFKIKNGLNAKRYLGQTATSSTSTNYYDISGASFDTGETLSLTDSSPMDLYFKSDGTKLYYVGAGNDTVREYTLSPAWDLNGATLAAQANVSTLASMTIPSGIFFKSDGSKMYVGGYGTDAIYEFDLSTAWDISSSSISYNSVSLDVSGVDNIPFGLFFKPDGTKMYFSGDQYDVIQEYNLSTAWDISSSSASFNQSSPSIIPSPRGLYFTSDGLNVFISSNDTNQRNVTHYSLSTAWDVSSIEFVRDFDLTGTGETNPYGSWFKPDGTKFYTLGSGNDTVYQYSTTSSTETIDLSAGNYLALSLSGPTTLAFSNPPETGKALLFTLEISNSNDTTTWPSGIKWENGITPKVYSDKQIFTFLTVDGGTTYYGKKAGETFS